MLQPMNARPMAFDSASMGLLAAAWFNWAPVTVSTSWDEARTLVAGRLGTGAELVAVEELGDRASPSPKSTTRRRRSCWRALERSAPSCSQRPNALSTTPSPGRGDHRKVVRADLADVFATVVRQIRSRLSKEKAGVMGAALVSLLEVAASSMLSRDQAFKRLGAKGSLETAIALANRIVDV